jgi:hypothetical protein
MAVPDASFVSVARFLLCASFDPLMNKEVQLSGSFFSLSVPPPVAYHSQKVAEFLCNTANGREFRRPAFATSRGILSIHTRGRLPRKETERPFIGMSHSGSTAESTLIHRKADIPNGHGSASSNPENSLWKPFPLTAESQSIAVNSSEMRIRREQRFWNPARTSIVKGSNSDRSSGWKLSRLMQECESPEATKNSQMPIRQESKADSRIPRQNSTELCNRGNRMCQLL